MTTAGTWLLAFALTCALEIPVVLALTRGHGRRSRRALVAFAAQVLTHPLVWFVFPELTSLSPNMRFVLAELMAVVVEAVAYVLFVPELPRLRAFGVSGIANGLSFGIGLVALHLLSHDA